MKQVIIPMEKGNIKHNEELLAKLMKSFQRMDNVTVNILFCNAVTFGDTTINGDGNTAGNNMINADIA